MNKILKLIFLFVIFTANIFAQTYEHFIITGQSLSTGMQTWPPLSTQNVPNNYMIGDQVWINYGNTSVASLNPLISKMAPDGHASEPKTTASMITCECPVVSAVNHIKLKTGDSKNYIASSCGSAGRTVEELSKEYYNPSCYNDFTKTITAAYNLTKNVHCPAIFWMQGEYNYSTLPIAFSSNDGLLNSGTFTADKAKYKDYLLKLKNNMQNDIIAKYGQSDKPLFITYQTGKYYVQGKTLEIGMAQLEASNENDDIVSAGPDYFATDRGGHLDPNGARWFGEIMGKVYYKTKVLGETFKPLQPLQISRTADPKTIRVKFLVPVLPLVFETNLVPQYADNGFQIYLNGTKVTLSSEVINGDCVDLTSTTNLTGDVEIIYAGAGGSTAGKGNLRDSDPYTAISSYIDLDKKVNNVYVYERDASASTLRSPTYEPKFVDGSSYYDKPYQLFNFCMAFYYKLSAASQVFDVPNLTPGAAKVKVSAITVSPTDLSISVGQNATVSSSLTPANPTNTSIVWTSSNPLVAYVINGVVTAVGSGQTVITAKSVDQGLTASCNVTCTAIAEQAYPNGNPVAFKSKVEFENFNKGGEGLAYHDVTAGNKGGVCRTDVNTDIASCTEGGYMVNNTSTGEWMNYMVTVPSTGNYYLLVRYAGLAASKVHFELNGVNISGSFTLPASYTGTTVVFRTESIPVSLSAGNLNLRFVVESGDSYYNYFSVSDIAAPNDIIPINYFVDPSATTSGNGSSWATAFKTIGEVETAASGNMAVNNIYIKGTAAGSPITTSSAWTLKAENYYFSCDPSNTGTAIVRTMNDNDGNGIIEPWEFKYPTVFKSTYSGGNAITLVGSTLLDGLTVSNINADNSAISKTNVSTSSFINPVGGVVQNCVFSGSNLSYTLTGSTSPGGCLIKNLGDLNNCLVEKNSVTTSFGVGSADKQIAPIFEFNLGTTAVSSTLSGSVFRNNTAKISSSTTATFTGGYIRGLIVNVAASNTANTIATISNCLIYNNEMAYTNTASSGGVATLAKASTVGMLTFSGSASTDIWINNTIVNNKMTNCASAMYLIPGGTIVHKAYNNVFWNNQNNNLAVSLSSGASSTGMSAGSDFSNNVMDATTTGTWIGSGSSIFANNLTNLSKLNSTANTGPQFLNPTTVIGNSTGGSIETADWRLNIGSYLEAKGIPTNILTDKAGNNFATPPAVGAYEYMFSTAVESVRNDVVIGKVVSNSFVCGIDAKMEIYSTSGKLIKSVIANKGQKITLTSGVYIVKAKTGKGDFVQKIVLS